VVALGEEPTRDRKGKIRVICRKDRRGFFGKNQAVFDATFGGGDPLVLSEADQDTMFVNLSAGGENDFTIDELPAVVLIARYVLADPGVTVERARNGLGINAKVFGGLKDKMVANDVLVHPVRKGLSPGPGMRAFLIFANLFGFDDSDSATSDDGE
jgi:hypothetical protein